MILTEEKIKKLMVKFLKVEDIAKILKLKNPAGAGLALQPDITTS
jgi:hypothetical protein